MANAKIGLIVTPEHRVVFWNNTLWEAVPYVDPKTKRPKGDPKYSYIALFPKATDINSMKQTAIKVAKAKWGDDVDLKTVRFPFKSGDAEANRLLENAKKKGAEKSESSVEFYRDTIMVKVSSNFAPKVVDNAGEDIIDQSLMYSGVKARAEFNFNATEITDPDGDKRYVSAYVNFVMKTGDAPRLSGKSAKDVFKGLLGGTTTADPTAASDDTMGIE